MRADHGVCIEGVSRGADTPGPRGTHPPNPEGHTPQLTGWHPLDPEAQKPTPPRQQKESQTRVKILPILRLRLRAVKIEEKPKFYQ